MFIVIVSHLEKLLSIYSFFLVQFQSELIFTSLIKTMELFWGKRIIQSSNVLASMPFAIVIAIGMSFVIASKVMAKPSLISL